MDEQPDDIRARRDAWSAYWARGALHSCAGSYEGNYGGAIGAFWDALVLGLAPGARVLDLATGNGALPLRMLERRPGPDGPRVDAVDLAAVAPPWFDAALHPGIAFHPGVSIDALPFADGRFDLVGSQYGIEYAPMPAALDEALRVLRPGGTLALVMHHAGSVLVAVGRQELAHLRLLRGEDGLLAAADRVLPWLQRARMGEPLAGNAGAARARAAYNAAMEGIGQAIAGSGAPDLLVEARQQVHRLLARGGPGASAGIAALAESLDDAMLRTSEMVSHALDDGAVASIVDRIRAARPSADIRCEPLDQAEGLLGWGVVASG